MRRPEAASRRCAADRGYGFAAKAKLQARAVSYADLHHEAARNAATRGDGRPSQSALEHMRVIEPIISKEAGIGVTVVVGVALQGSDSTDRARS
jgi:hypothetical protein